MTLRSRLLFAVALIAAVVVLSAVSVARITTGHLIGQLDEQLARFAERPGPGGGNFAPGTPVVPPQSASEDPGASSLFVGTFQGDELSTLLVPSLGAEETAVPELGVEQARVLAGSGRAISVSSTVEGTEYRVAVQDGPTGSGGPVVVGVQLNDVNDVVGRLMWVLAVASLLVLLLLGLVTWWVMRLGVRPLRQMTRAATEVATGDLTMRIPAAPAGTEAGELGAALNTMLQRIEQALSQSRSSEQRLRRFLADASHELRTPITTIRGYAELYRLGGLGDPAALDAAIGRTEAESIRMARLVEDLLELARLDQGDQPAFSAVRLDRIARDVVADVGVVHPARSIAMRTAAVEVMGNADHLQQVVANLVNNAVVHTPPDTPVAVDVSLDPISGLAILRVTDTGPGMSAADMERAFERFHRADPSRSRASGGSGLGLAIVEAIVAEHRGTVRIDPTDPGAGTRPGITVTVALPTSAP